MLLLEKIGGEQSISVLLGVGCFLLATACGDVNEAFDADGGTPDAGGDSDPDGRPDAVVECDDGWTGSSCEECVVYVDGDAGDDERTGLTWAEARATIQAGSELAGARLVTSGVDSCSVWVRAGTYLPGTERTDSFALVAGVHLYGGFSGGEGARDERDFVANETILSGDLAEDDDPGTPATRDENAYHVVIGADGAVLDGLTITAGVADGADADRYGGGLYNDAASPTLANVIFRGNAADGYGGAMLNQDGAPVLTSVSFTDNSGGSSAGALYNVGGAAILTDVTFTGNSSGGEAGAMSESSSASVLTNVSFTANTATFGGGAMRSVGESAPVLTNVTFSDNEAGSVGGAIRNFGATPVLTNVVFAGNTAGTSGGGFYSGLSDTVIITNATFYGNAATQTGGAVRGASSSDIRVRNSILWGNAASDGADEVDAPLLVTHSIVQGGKPATVADEDWVESSGEQPLFVEAPENLRLLADSPAVDAGNSQLADLPDEDLDGDPRVADGDGDGTADIDMGAYEYQP